MLVGVFEAEEGDEVFFLAACFFFWGFDSAFLAAAAASLSEEDRFLMPAVLGAFVAGEGNSLTADDDSSRVCDRFRGLAAILRVLKAV